MAVNLKHAERRLGGGQVDGAGGTYLGIIADAAQQAVGDTWRSTRAAGDFDGAGTIDAHAENLGGTLDNEAEIVVVVELEPQQQAETGAQWRGEQSCARGGANEGEGLYVHRVRPRGRALADHDVELVVFERGVEDLFERGLQAVDFIDEEHLAVAKIGKDRCEGALNLPGGAGGLRGSSAGFV